MTSLSSSSSNNTLCSSSPMICAFLWMPSPTAPCECISYGEAFSTSYNKLIIAWSVITYSFLAIAAIQSYRVGVFSSLYHRVRYALKHERVDKAAAQLTIQKRMHLMVTVVAVILCTRQMDPLGWNHIIPWGVLGLLTDGAGTVTLSLICSSVFSFIHVMYRIAGSGRRGVVHLVWMERCFHLVLILSFAIVSAQQAYTSPTYAFKATKYVILILFILSLMISAFISGYTIVTALQKSISSLRDSQPSPPVKTRQMITTPNTPHQYPRTITTPNTPQLLPRQLSKGQTPLTPMRTLALEKAHIQAQARRSSAVQDYNFPNVMIENISPSGSPPSTTTTIASIPSTAPTSPTASPLSTLRSVQRPVSAADSSLKAIKSMVTVFAVMSSLGVAAVIFMIITLITILRQKEDYFILAHVPAPPSSVIDSSLPLDLIEIGAGLWALKSFRKVSRRDNMDNSIPTATPQQRPPPRPYTATRTNRKTPTEVPQPMSTMTTRTLTQAYGPQHGIGTPSPDTRILFMTRDGEATARPEIERDIQQGIERKQEIVIETSTGTETEMVPTPTMVPVFTAAPLSPSSFHLGSFDMISSPSSFQLDGTNPDSTYQYVHVENTGHCIKGTRRRVSLDYQPYEHQLDGIQIDLVSPSD